MRLGRREEAIRALAAVADRLSDTSDVRLREHAAVALKHKPVVLSEFDGKHAVLMVLDEVITRFHDLVPQVQFARQHKQIAVRRAVGRRGERRALG